MITSKDAREQTDKQHIELEIKQRKYILERITFAISKGNYFIDTTENLYSKLKSELAQKGYKITLDNNNTRIEW